jgi:hypothetical protein
MHLPTIKSEYVDLCLGGKHVLRGRCSGAEQDESREVARATRNHPRVNHVPCSDALPLPSQSQNHFALRLLLPWPTSPKKSKFLANYLETALINERYPNSIEISTRAADHFTRLYYSAYDSSTRVDDLPNFYRPNSAVSWNGNPHEGSQGVRDLISKMPKTLHEVQSFDCHPIPGG